MPLRLAGLIALAAPGLAAADDLPQGEAFESIQSLARVPESSPTGAFVYAVPIEVPAGRGPVPELALTYDSQQGTASPA